MLKAIHSEISFGLRQRLCSLHTKSELKTLPNEMGDSCLCLSVTAAHTSTKFSLMEQIKTYLLHVGLLELSKQSFHPSEP